MSNKSVIIDGLSIVSHLTSLAKPSEGKGSDPLVRDFIGHVRGQVAMHNPVKAIVIMPPSEMINDHSYGAIHRIISAMGLRQITTDRSSIGPTISILARQLAEEGQVLLSGYSLSLTQLISPNISFQRFGDDNVFNEQKLIQMIGLSAKQIPDLISMIGDKDMGLASLIGSNTAINWLRNYGSLQGILDNADKLPSAMRNELSKNIVEIKDRLFSAAYINNEYEATEIDLKTIDRQRIDVNKLYREFIDNKLFDWLPDELRQKYTPKTNMGSDLTFTTIINSHSMMVDLMEMVKTKNSCSIVINDRDQDGFAISFKEGESWYIPLDASSSSKWGYDYIKLILESKDIRKVTHSARDTYLWAIKRGITINAILSDSAILSYSLDSRESEKTLGELSQLHLNIAVRSDNQIPGIAKKPNEALYHQQIAGFNGEKADVIWRLNRCLYKKATHDGATRSVFEKYERPLIGLLARMESKGMLLDVSSLDVLGNDLRKKAEDIVSRIKEISGKDINLNAPVQVADLLYGTLNLPILKKTNKGKPSTSEDTLLALSEKHEVPKLIIEHRSISVLLSTYVDGLCSRVNTSTGRIHTTLMQNVAITGRLSSRKPNLQNIPIRTEDGRKIRKAFVSGDGKYLIAADYSQIELRVLAHLSGDKGLVNAFNSGVDIHRATAAEIFGIKQEDVTGEQRRSVKSINFGLIYGMSAYGLAKQLSISVQDAEGYIGKYFEKYPQVRVFMDNTIRQARKNGFVTTISGRKIYTPNINSSIHKERAAAERAAQNAPVQGSAADIIKLAMINVEKELEDAVSSASMLMQVHDELIFEVKTNEVKKSYEIIKKVMESAISLSVPLTVEVDIGKNWEQSHSIMAKEGHADIDLVLDM